MNAILGFGQLLQMDELDELQSESVEQIVKAGRHLLELINEVLDLSRIEAGGLDVTLEPVSASEVMREALEMTRTLANAANIKIEMQSESDIESWVLGDARRLRQILINLLANAIKYNRDSGSVTLRCQRGADGANGKDGIGPRLRFVVSDTGPGIAPNKLDKLFVPFERLDAEGGEIEGTGLGLTLCKRLTEAMNGQIGLESVVGEGSSFWIEFPSAHDPSITPSTVIDENATAGVNCITSLLLYIEDNSSNIKLMQRILTKRPAIRLLPASTGEAGLQLARTHFPDLILLDLQLPDIGGDKVLEQLAQDPTTRDIPVVMLSADATQRQIERLLKAGARHYLTKPLDVSQLLGLLDELLYKGAKRLLRKDPSRG
jgi:CheY-like chemotaxis protein